MCIEVYKFWEVVSIAGQKLNIFSEWPIRTAVSTYLVHSKPTIWEADPEKDPHSPAALYPQWTITIPKRGLVIFNFIKQNTAIQAHNIL